MINGAVREDIDPRPCPCCGGDAVLSSRENNNIYSARIKCTNCGLKIQRTTHNAPYGVQGCVRYTVLAWNSRKGCADV